MILGTASYFLTGNIKESLNITLLFNIVQTILYFVHERIWNKIGWGKD
ncbi:MAG: DUF2061 domain-containing protein [Spirochaetales bacterium]|nr:DUF2061 domain-containing protein [Spirochaetales bacterium]